MRRGKIMGRKRREVADGESKVVIDDPDRVPETDVEALVKEIEGLATTGPVEEKGGRLAEGYAAEVTDPTNPLYPQHVLGWYVKNQIQASPLTPAEIAERSGVSVSQIYR